MNFFLSRMGLFKPKYVNVSMIDNFRQSLVKSQYSIILISKNNFAYMTFFHRKSQASGGPTFAAGLGGAHDTRPALYTGIGQPRSNLRSEAITRASNLLTLAGVRGLRREFGATHTILLLDRTSCPPDKKLKS